MRQLWQMHHGHEQSRRQLALDVRQMIWCGDFDAEQYLLTGKVAQMQPIQNYPMPENPLIEQEIKRIEAQRKARADGK